MVETVGKNMTEKAKESKKDTKEKKDKKDSYFKNLVVKIVDNIQVYSIIHNLVQILIDAN